MALFHGTHDGINCFPSDTDSFCEKRPECKIGNDSHNICLDNDPVYLEGNAGSCYWMDSQGLTIRFCDVGSVKDISRGDLNLILSTVLASVSSFEEDSVMGFAELLFSRIEDVFDMSLGPGNSMDVFLGWKSIALLILSSGRPAKAGIGVRIGSEDYRISC